MKWHICTRGRVPLHRLAISLVGVYKFSSSLGGSPVENVFYFVNESKTWWAWDKQELRNLGQHVIKICSESASQEKHFQELEKYIKAANEVAEKVRTQDLTSLTNGQLAQMYDGLCNVAMPAQGWTASDIDAIDVVFEKFLLEKIAQELGDKGSQVTELYRQISTPLYESFVTTEEKGKLQLALKSKITDKDIDDLYNQFWWTKIGWEDIRPHTKKNFVTTIQKLRQDPGAKNKLAEIERSLDRIAEQRQKLVKQYNLSAEFQYWLKIIDRYAYLHDQRKEMQMRTNYSLYLVLREIAQRRGLNSDDLEWLWPKEVVGLLGGKKIDSQEVARRQQAIAIRVAKGGIKTYSGQAAVGQYQKELLEDYGDVKEVTGVGVSGEKIRAQVKVCAGLVDALKKVREGDVLICGMTMPDYVPAMKKAAAIVTNEGGVTCHAAIISRELNIPCVVGTKIATQVFEDGDEVEVDAEKGIVRKII